MKHILLLLLALLICLSAIAAGCALQPDAISATGELAEASVDADSDVGIMEVYVFDVGKADAILIMTENHTVLIDTGEDPHGQLITDELLSRGIDAIDYLIITHFDKDHVGGAHTVIRNIAVGEVVVPNYRRDSRHYLRFAEAMRDMGIEPVVLEKFNTLEFILDGVVFTTYPSNLDFVNYNAGQDDNEEDYDNEDDEDNDLPNVNNFSLVTRVTHGNNNFLFTGDAKARRIREMLSLREIADTRWDFLKVPHHGRYNRRSIEFISTIRPDFAVITSSFDNPADNEVVTALESVGAVVFFTINGNIRCISDGNTLTVEHV